MSAEVRAVSVPAFSLSYPAAVLLEKRAVAFDDILLFRREKLTFFFAGFAFGLFNPEGDLFGLGLHPRHV